MLSVKDRIKSLAQLGKQMDFDSDPDFQRAFRTAQANNQWFTQENIRQSLDAIKTHFCNEEKIERWLQPYKLFDNIEPKNVGMVLAGNIPCVGIHDVFSCYISGHIANIKYSEKDEYLIPAILDKLVHKVPEANSYFKVVERMNHVDAIIATGSNNSARYFEYYFKDKPHIIRKNRTSVAILHGDESEEQLLDLGKDVFDYFGLGCRNVSKLYIHESFKIESVLKAFEAFDDICNHHKYKNNYDYNYAIYLLNKDPFLANNCLIVKQDKSLHSRIACVHYEYFSDLSQVLAELSELNDELQCLLSSKSLATEKNYLLGNSQEPELWDYADNVDTMQFLLNLNK